MQRVQLHVMDLISSCWPDHRRSCPSKYQTILVTLSFFTINLIVIILQVGIAQGAGACLVPAGVADTVRWRSKSLNTGLQAV